MIIGLISIFLIIQFDAHWLWYVAAITCLFIDLGISQAKIKIMEEPKKEIYNLNNYVTNELNRLTPIIERLEAKISSISNDVYFMSSKIGDNQSSISRLENKIDKTTSTQADIYNVEQTLNGIQTTLDALRYSVSEIEPQYRPPKAHYD